MKTDSMGGWEWVPAPEELSAEHTGVYLDEDVPCPRCHARLDRVVAGLWICDECGGVWRLNELAQPPGDWQI